MIIKHPQKPILQNQQTELLNITDVSEIIDTMCAMGIFIDGVIFHVTHLWLKSASPKNKWSM